MPDYVVYDKTLLVAASRAAHATPLAYHEAYWVVIGTAAPVIALSLVVSWSQVGRRFINMLRQPGNRPVPGWVGTFVAGIALGIASVAQVLAFRMSLQSLSTGKDGPLGLSTDLTFMGLVCVLGVQGGNILNAYSNPSSGAKSEEDSEESDDVISA